MPGLDKFERKTVTKNVLPQDYTAYSDARNYQYIIPFNEKVANVEAIR